MEPETISIGLKIVPSVRYQKGAGIVVVMVFKSKITEFHL